MRKSDAQFIVESKFGTCASWTL